MSFEILIWLIGLIFCFANVYEPYIKTINYLIKLIVFIYTFGIGNISKFITSFNIVSILINSVVLLLGTLFLLMLIALSCGIIRDFTRKTFRKAITKKEALLNHKNKNKRTLELYGTHLTPSEQKAVDNWRSTQSFWELNGILDEKQFKESEQCLISDLIRERKTTENKSKIAR